MAKFSFQNAQISLATLGLLALFGASWSDSGSLEAADPSLEVLPDHSLQIQADLQGTIRANSNSKTYLDFANSGYTPRDLFLNIDALKSQAAWTSLCQGLSALPPQDLALFEDELSSPKFKTKAPCAGPLLTKIHTYWSVSAKALSKNESFAETLQNGFTLPSLEVPIDISLPSVPNDGALKEGQIALTFDDGPHGSRTSQILEILAEADVRATFFEVGEAVQANPAITAAVRSAGHTVASHTWDHPQLPKLTLGDAERNILRGRRAVADAMHDRPVDIPFFRFPYGAGAHAPLLLDLLKKHQMTSFFWTMDSLDWKLRDPQKLLGNVLKELDREKKGILLFHDIHEQTILVLPYVLAELHKRGYETMVFIPH